MPTVPYDDPVTEQYTRQLAAREAMLNEIFARQAQQRYAADEAAKARLERENIMAMQRGWDKEDQSTKRKEKLSDDETQRDLAWELEGYHTYQKERETEAKNAADEALKIKLLDLQARNEAQKEYPEAGITADMSEKEWKQAHADAKKAKANAVFDSNYAALEEADSRIKSYEAQKAAIAARSYTPSDKRRAAEAVLAEAKIKSADKLKVLNQLDKEDPDSVMAATAKRIGDDAILNTYLVKRHELGTESKNTDMAFVAQGWQKANADKEKRYEEFINHVNGPLKSLVDKDKLSKAYESGIVPIPQNKSSVLKGFVPTSNYDVPDDPNKGQNVPQPSIATLATPNTTQPFVPSVGPQEAFDKGGLVGMAWNDFKNNSMQQARNEEAKLAGAAGLVKGLATAAPVQAAKGFLFGGSQSIGKPSEYDVIENRGRVDASRTPVTLADASDVEKEGVKQLAIKLGMTPDRMAQGQAMLQSGDAGAIATFNRLLQIYRVMQGGLGGTVQNPSPYQQQ